MDKRKIHKESPVIPWVMLGVAVLSVILLVMPFGKYEYGDEYWQISGLNLMTGTTIMGGSVYIGISALVWIGVLAAIVIAADCIVFRKLRVRTAGVIALVSAFV